MLGMRKHTFIHAGALCTLYAQSKACAGGLYLHQLGYCSVAQRQKLPVTQLLDHRPSLPTDMLERVLFCLGH